MSLVFRDIDTALSGLHGRLLRGLKALDMEVDDAEEFRLVAATPTYSVAGRHLAQSGLRAASESGWRALVVQGDTLMALLEVVRADGKPHTALRDHASAEVFRDALAIAARYDALEAVFDVRFLVAADAHISAVWLDGPSSLFIPTRLGRRYSGTGAPVLDSHLLMTNAQRLGAHQTDQRSSRRL